MFSQLREQKPDPIIGLIKLFRDDPRDDKIDLGIGVYRTEDGRTPVFAAVKDAELRIWQRQDTKTYTSLTGDPAFFDAMADLVFAGAADRSRLTGAAVPGGTSAIRQLLELYRRANPDGTVWMPDPTWPNHPAIIGCLGLSARVFRFYDRSTGGIDRAAMFSDLEGAASGDLILLHACCHNPTGADLGPDDWRDVAALVNRTGAIPFVDSAYQGFGASLTGDAAGLRALCGEVPEMLISVSCSKNFGLYRERTAMAFVLSETPADAALVTGNLANLNRQNFAFPPDHGARVATEVLTDPELRTDWETELSAMCARIRANRNMLCDALAGGPLQTRFDYLRRQNGMFSELGLDDAQVERLRGEHGIYMVGGGRVNMAGLTARETGSVAAAIAAVIA